jgi:hypothetical protein
MKCGPLSLPEKAPATSQFLLTINASLAAASSLRQAKKRLTSSYQVISLAL